MLTRVWGADTSDAVETAEHQVLALQRLQQGVLFMTWTCIRM